ncbi:sperm acrosome membrane-associated protein 4-like [Syngnathoides biaculeatus]|uniref:sperm acrosome membrane-associated protein 4-like n=1 Tax=Syngnathoides biaculeatus TaxID=300417 RepID=UPI002ADE11A7|nr:sperm acrosome membrane-associated protein 4-like [Syngnathoides biaculeatus]XP_061675316.1 sperm acrosome membrane-associated protein 4-like [Syngnathoides biaculeatus]XP_061675405.1 sperm acrosome membrane-associated protein 4-like [Syngnathoides biaculeatus]
MNRIILQLFAVGVCFAIGQALECYECKIGFWNLCITKKITCETGQECFTGKGSAAGFVDVTMKGCLAKNECNSSKDVNFPSSSNTTIYKMKKTCCNTHLCNGAPGILGGSLVLASVAALLTANMLV